MKLQMILWRVSDSFLRAGIKLYVYRNDCLRYLGVPLVRVSFWIARIGGTI